MMTKDTNTKTKMLANYIILLLFINNVTIHIRDLIKLRS